MKLVTVLIVAMAAILTVSAEENKIADALAAAAQAFADKVREGKEVASTAAPPAATPAPGSNPAAATTQAPGSNPPAVTQAPGSSPAAATPAPGSNPAAATTQAPGSNPPAVTQAPGSGAAAATPAPGSGAAAATSAPGSNPPAANPAPPSSNAASPASPAASTQNSKFPFGAFVWDGKQVAGAGSAGPFEFAGIYKKPKRFWDPAGFFNSF